MRVAVTGAGGRLGRALMEALAAGPSSVSPEAWDRAEFDLDHPAGIVQRLDTSGVDLVIHAAAWTDVDGCARGPDLAMHRNAEATGVLASACAARGMDLVVMSTNEVFDGTRLDGRPYGPGDVPSPANPYGASKLAGERAAVSAYTSAGGPGTLGIIRTAWLFGSGAADFPAKVAVAAAAAAASGEPLRVVGDEIGTPTYARDLAEAVAELVGAHAMAGIHHLVNNGRASRADWARDVLARLNIEATVVEIPLSAWARPSRPPPWGVLEPTALPTGPAGRTLRPWPDAMADYTPELRRAVSA